MELCGTNTMHLVQSFGVPGGSSGHNALDWVGFPGGFVYSRFHCVVIIISASGQVELVELKPGPTERCGSGKCFCVCVCSK